MVKAMAIPFSRRDHPPKRIFTFSHQIFCKNI